MKNYKIVLYTLFIFWILFMNGSWVGLNPTINGWIKNAMAFILIIPLLGDIKKFLNGKYKYINYSLLAFCVISYISAYLNFDMVNALKIQKIESATEIVDLNAQLPKGVLYQMLSLISTAYFIEKNAELGKTMIMIKTFFYSLFILVVFADLDALNNTDIESGNSYLVGNKFAVTYMNIYVCVLYNFMNPRLKSISKFVLYLLIGITVFMCIHTQCSTALIGIGLFVILSYLIPREMKGKLFSPRFLFISLFVCDIVFFFFTTWFLQFSFVQDFIVNVLHEDITLTGRLDIYMNIQDAFLESPLLGFGSGNSSAISVMYTGAYDAQNGLVDMFVQVGLLGCAAFLFFLYYIFNYLEKNNTELENEKVYPIVVFVYMMVAISMVEIPFNDKFIFFTMFLLASNINKSEKEKKWIRLA